jgi:Ca-activated chloride channel family protein
LEPARFVGLVVPGALAAWYLSSRGRSRYEAIRFSTLETAVAAGIPRGRRHATAVVVLLALVVMVVAFARPVMAVPTPVEQATVVLAIDVSRSMGAEDVAPSRLAAAQQAAVRFLGLAPTNLRVGLVAFAGTAIPVVEPTTDRTLLAAAVERLDLADGTAVGEAVFAALGQIERAGLPDAAPVGVVVLSDGESNVGRSELEAAAVAGAAAVPVSTISFGTQEGEILNEGSIVGVPVQEGRLAELASSTGGTFYRAADEAELRTILDEVGSDTAFEIVDREVTDWFAGGAFALAAAAFALSIRWLDRMA